MKRSGSSHPDSIQRRLRRMVLAFGLPALAIVVAVLAMTLFYHRSYTDLLHNVTTASEFNQDFKSEIDLKMYYYVIESQYSEGLPIQQVRDAQALAQELLSTTTQRDSRRAITSVLDLCRNLEEKIYQIRDTQDYDSRQEQLENNIYVLTSLIQEFMYNYLYYESVQLNALQQQVQERLTVEMAAILLLTAGLVLALTHQALRLGRSITQPIVDLCARAEQLSQGDLTPREPVKSEEYEIRTLSEGFEQMAGRLDTLLRESNQRQDHLRRAELALLQAQINPHFFYNTMDTIVWLIEAEKPREAVEMVSNLSEFFRRSLSKGKDVITLAEEEGHVRSYLQIQQVRYKDIMQYTIHMAPGTGTAMVPKLTLQPLVENALYHGIKMKRGMGHIYVTSRPEGEDILLQVTDDGAGIPPDRLEQLVQGMEKGERVGFGLATVHERIRLLFGAPYGLSLSSRLGVGTTVTVRIPRRGQEEVEEK